ncbi:MAG: efflux transporter outer membrane subunit [Waddliaceae bacterium]
MRKAITIGLMAVVLLSLNSCFKVGPNFRPPTPPPKCEWIDANDKHVKSAEPLYTWWKVFEDPLLDHLILTAYRQNLPLKVACFRIMEARARLGIAIGEFFPQQQEGFGSATRWKLSENQANIGPMPDIYFQDYQLGLQVAWELDFWGRFRRAIESEGALVSASIADYDDVLVLLLSDVAAVYVTIRTTQELIEIVKNNIKLQKRSLDITEANFEGGFVSELDVKQATTLLRGTEARLPDLQRQLRQAENAMSVLLGIVPQDLECLFDGKASIPSASADILVGMPESLLQRRPDIRRALYDAAAQSARIGVAFSDFFPQLFLSGMIGYRSSGNSMQNPNEGGGNLFAKDSLTFNYGTSFVWPLLNYGRIYNSVRLERARFCQLVYNYKNIVLQAYQEVEDGIVAFLKAHKQETYLSESVKAAKRSVELANTQYVEGLADYTRVLNTQQAQLAEEERHALVRGEIAFGLIATYKALGGGWQLRCRPIDASDFSDAASVKETIEETPIDDEKHEQIRKTET